MVKSSTTQARDRDTEQRILDAAHTVFLRRGTAGARMQEIAEEAGVNKALLHYYFRSKERLSEAVFQQVAKHLLPPLVALLASDLELEEKVRRIVALELDVLSASPFLPGYLIGELNQNPERGPQLFRPLVGDPAVVRPRIFEAIGRQIEERVQAGTMRRIAPDQFVVNLLALCIFPFAVRPMIKVLMGADDAGFQEFIRRRRDDLVTYILASMRP